MHFFSAARGCCFLQLALVPELRQFHSLIANCPSRILVLHLPLGHEATLADQWGHFHCTICYLLAQRLFAVITQMSQHKVYDRHRETEAPTFGQCIKLS